MDFSGTWKVYSQENLEEFLKTVGTDVFSYLKDWLIDVPCADMFICYLCVSGAPPMIVKMRKEVKPVIVIEQKGKDFTYTMKTPVCTKVHSFSLGQESEMESMDGSKFKVISSKVETEEKMLEMMFFYFSYWFVICNLICINWFRGWNCSWVKRNMF